MEVYEYNTFASQKETSTLWTKVRAELSIKMVLLSALVIYVLLQYRFKKKTQRI